MGSSLPPGPPDPPLHRVPREQAAPYPCQLLRHMVPRARGLTYVGGGAGMGTGRSSKRGMRESWRQEPSNLGRRRNQFSPKENSEIRGEPAWDLNCTQCPWWAVLSLPRGLGLCGQTGKLTATLLSLQIHPTGVFPQS